MIGLQIYLRANPMENRPTFSIIVVRRNVQNMKYGFSYIDSNQNYEHN